ncbi:MAG: hypothetical protein M3083_16695 [Actinomycetota bacterium]|nr:hypothetical protein [Actinomycetota bacterium]
MLRVTPIALDNGLSGLLSSVALDESHEAETDSVGPSGSYAFVDERVDFSQ